MFAGAIERFPEAVNGNEWIALDANVLADHAGDPLNALADPMSNRFVADFVAMYDAVNEGWPRATPHSPSSSSLANRIRWQTTAKAPTTWPTRCGSMVAATYARLYSGVCHEIHNEPPTRIAVEQEVIGFRRDTCRGGKHAGGGLVRATQTLCARLTAIATASNAKA